MTEIYKDIPEYEGLYQASNLGNIKSNDRYNTDKHGKTKFYPGRLLKQEVSRERLPNYFRVTLSKNGETKKFFVHRLVAITFIQNPDNKPYINHIDNNGQNNLLENLEWCTHSENIKYSQEQGRQFENQSKAGKTSGENKMAQILDEISSKVGETIGNFKILSYHSKGVRYYNINCLCLRCNSLVVTRYLAVKNQTISRCKHCRNIKGL